MITLALIAGVGVFEAKAATSDSIAVTVTLQNISVSMTPDVWDIVAIVPGDSIKLVVVATNDGNVDEDLTISTSDSAGWVAGASADTDQFLMEFKLGVTPTFPGTEITNAGVTLVDPLAVGTQDFELQFTAPTNNSVGETQQDITVTVSAAAA